MTELAANDNTPNASEVSSKEHNADTQFAIDSLGMALKSFVPRDELKSIVQQEIINTSCMYKMEIKTGEIAKVIEGHKHKLFPDILTVVSNNLPAALIGPAGSGKSTCCEQIASALSLKFYLQNGVTGTHELTGYVDAHGKYITTAFRACFEHGGLLLVDEVDTSEPGALKWVNSALANGWAAFPDSPNPVLRHADFRIAFAANTWGSGADRLYVGANQLDASTLDRFVFFEFGYDEQLEKLLSTNVGWAERVQAIRKAAMEEKARIVVSPRASINGAKLLAAGWSMAQVEAAVIWKGIDIDLKGRIEKRLPIVYKRPDGYDSSKPLTEAQKKELKAKYKKVA